MKRLLLATSILGGIAMVAPVMANPLTITKAQQAEVFQGTDNLGRFQPVIGTNPPFGTTSIDISFDGGAMNLTLHTTFAGSYVTNGDCFGAVCAHIADIALSTDGGRTYGYGIALGQQGKSPGLYRGIILGDLPGHLGSLRRGIPIWGQVGDLRANPLH